MKVTSLTRSAFQSESTTLEDETRAPTLLPWTRTLRQDAVSLSCRAEVSDSFVRVPARK